MGTPNPSPPKLVCAPLGPKGGEQHYLAGERIRGPNSDDWIESLALLYVYSLPSTFCYQDPRPPHCNPSLTHGIFLCITYNVYNVINKIQ